VHRYDPCEVGSLQTTWNCTVRPNAKSGIKVVMTLRKKRAEKKVGRCVFCGVRGPITREHIPAQNLFPPPMPSNLITVPSCRKCNSEWQRDEDYFRLWLVAREDTKGNPARDALFPTVNRSLARVEARGFLKSFMDSLAKAEQVTPAGIYVRSGTVVTTEGSRLDRIAEKIIRGLFYYETGRRVPPDYRVAIVHQSRVRHLRPAFRTDLLGFVAMVLETKPREFGPAFKYWYLPSPNGWARSHWILEFYGSREFYCFTAPIISAPKNPARLPT